MSQQQEAALTYHSDWPSLKIGYIDCLMAGPIVYSANPWYATEIAEKYRQGIYFAWVCEFFDSEREAPANSAGALIAPSSNPRKIYEDLWSDYKNQDDHSRVIKDLKKTFRRLAKNWLAAGELNRDQYDEIIASVQSRTWKIWKPVLYVIPRVSINPARIMEVRRPDRAAYGPEFECENIMIAYLQTLDKKLAAGLLARAALSLGYEGDPVAPLVVGEEKIRAGLLDEARKKLGVDSDDNRPETIERLADFLDEVSDAFLGSPNTGAALARLAERGDLPSDLYEIEIIDQVRGIHGKHFPLEKEIIETTIRAPTLEQHFGPPRKPYEPAMISLFARTFRTRWPLRDFVMLVAAQRDGFRLHVHQAWRIYSSRVNVRGAKTPVDWLSRFADVYGAEIEVEGKRGHFFLFATGFVPNSFKLPFDGKPREIVVSRFAQNDPVSGAEQSALIVAIDLFKYGKMLDDLRVKREDMLDEFVGPPRATA